MKYLTVVGPRGQKLHELGTLCPEYPGLRPEYPGCYNYGLFRGKFLVMQKGKRLGFSCWSAKRVQEDSFLQCVQEANLYTLVFVCRWLRIEWIIFAVDVALCALDFHQVQGQLSSTTSVPKYKHLLTSADHV